eukprot:6931331-Alexandrium_andersonii.AAC.1
MRAAACTVAWRSATLASPRAAPSGCAASTGEAAAPRPGHVHSHCWGSLGAPGLHFPPLLMSRALATRQAVDIKGAGDALSAP